MIKVTSTGSDHDRLGLLEHAINYSPVILPFVLTAGPVIFVTTAAVDLGGVVVDRSWSRKQLPDQQWVVRVAGRVDPADANGITFTLQYLSNAMAATAIGATTITGGGQVKWSMGPFDIFGTGGVPQGETIPLVRLIAQKLVSGTANVYQTNLWLELRPAKQ